MADRKDTLIAKKILTSHQYENFLQLEAEINKSESNNIKGEAFELFAKALLDINSRLYQLKKVYRREEVPDDIIKKLRLEPTDHGVDGVAISEDDQLIAYQVKFRSGKDNRLTYTELATFWTEADDADRCLVITNTPNLPKETRNRRIDQSSILYDELMSLDQTFFKQLFEYYQTNGTVSTKRIPAKPRSYQLKIINDCITGFESSRRGKLIAACGIGKTLIAKWIADRLECEYTVFFAPSLALIKQTIDSWHYNTDNPFSYMAICSDQTVMDFQIEDEVAFSTDEVSFPVTTDPEKVVTFLENSSRYPKVIFCTYQSSDALSTAITLYNAKHNQQFEFDLCLADEAHKTTSLSDSQDRASIFSIMLNDQFIPSKKRLFLTATERIYSSRIKKAYDESSNKEIYSMDDPKWYGKVLSRYSFGQAISEKVIADYQIIVFTLPEESLAEYGFDKNKTYVNVEGNEVTVDTNMLQRQIILSKALDSLPIKKVIVYENRVKTAYDFINGNNTLSFDQVFDQVSQEYDSQQIYCGTVDGSMSTKKRKEILASFSSSNIGVITNARCLTEGVDVPLIDAVYFAHEKNSEIDIIQAIGRALRKPHNQDKTSYIILPIILPEGVEKFEDIDPMAFNTIHSVVAALADQDKNIQEMIDAINWSNGGTYSRNKNRNIHINVIPLGKVAIEDFSEKLEVRIGNVNSKYAAERELLQKLQTGDRKSNFKRVFTTIGDYKMDALYNSLIMPTLQKYDYNNTNVLSRDMLSINNNNISHSVRFGAIKKSDSKEFILTEIGKILLDEKTDRRKVFCQQLLKYYSTTKSGTYIFPYRIWFECFKELNEIRKFDFVYSLYTIKDGNLLSIRQAIDRIKELQETYPNIDNLNTENKEKLLHILNQKYNLDLKFKSVFTSRDTVYNQFNFFVKHLLEFEHLFEFDKSNQTLKVVTPDYLEALLLRDQIMVTWAEENNFKKLENAITSNVY